MALEVLERQVISASGAKFSRSKAGLNWAFLAILVFLSLPHSLLTISRLVFLRLVLIHQPLIVQPSTTLCFTKLSPNSLLIPVYKALCLLTPLPLTLFFSHHRLSFDPFPFYHGCFSTHTHSFSHTGPFAFSRTSPCFLSWVPWPQTNSVIYWLPHYPHGGQPWSYAFLLSLYSFFRGPSAPINMEIIHH